MDLVEQLKALMERCGYSQTQVGRSIGRSGAVINQFLQGKYNGDNDDLILRLEGFICRELKKESARRVIENFIETPSALKGLEVLDYAHQEGEMCVIYGAAGLGKTMTLRAYEAKNPGTIFIEVDPGYTTRTLLAELCRQLGLKARGNIHDLIDACVKELRDTNRLVMIDEAELLPYRALEAIRRLHDKSGVGFVLAGMPRLLINLKGRGGEFAQLYSRVALGLDLGDVLPREDFDLLSANLMPESVDEEICDSLYKCSHGNARRLFKLVRGVYRICGINKTQVSVKAINKFAEMLIH